MADSRGALKVEANGKEYTLWLGMSVIADLQAKHGDNVLQKLEAPEGSGPEWVPPLQIIIDLFLGALDRHHADEADRYLVDDILAENTDVFAGLMAAAFPEQKAKPPGNAKRPKRAA